MTLRHRIRFYQQLAVLARAGVPLRASLQRLQGRFSGGEMAVLTQKIDAGEGIGDAFIKAGFSPFECHLVAAGERSARLEIIFQHLSEFWDRQLQMGQALIRPLYYPIAVLHLAIVVGALVEFAMGTALPLVIIHLVTQLATIYVIAFVAYMVIRSSWNSEAAQRIWLSIPLIGGTLSTAYAYRWITVLRIEYSAGIPMPNAVADAWQASGYVGRETFAREGEEALREGRELSTLVQSWKRLPRDWIDFIETGEVSGAIEAALERLNEEAARNWLVAQQQMTELLPKVLYFIVLLIAAAMVGATLYQVAVGPATNIEDMLNAK